MGDGGMVLPASTRSIEQRVTPPLLGNRIGKMPFTHPRLMRRHDRLIDRLLRGRGGTVVAVGAPVRVVFSGVAYVCGGAN
jgi:hypothetical protein